MLQVQVDGKQREAGAEEGQKKGQTAVVPEVWP